MDARTAVVGLTSADIPDAVRLTNSVGWRFEADDLERLLRLDPSSLLGARRAGRLIGLASALAFGELGWIGNVVVAADRRGVGLGRELIAAALARLEEQKVARIGLYATLPAVPLYARLGFTEGERVLTFAGRAGPARAGPSIARLGAPDLAEAISWDREAVGGDRGSLLRLLQGDAGAMGFAWRARGALTGFVLARGGPSSAEIGPWYARDAATADRLLDACLAALHGREIEVACPAGHRGAVPLLKARGFEPVRETVSMMRGAPWQRHPPSLWGVAGLEKG